MTLVVVHMSDWHGKMHEVPAAGLYVCTGDMLRNYPVIKGSACSPSYDKRREMNFQGKYVRDNSFRDCLGTKDAPVIIIRGNHDWVNLAQWVGGEVYEIGTSPKTFEVCGLKVSGYRGVSQINGGHSDELRPEHDRDRANELDEDIDLLVTHSPAYGIKDKVGKTSLGLNGLKSYITKRLYAPEPKPLVHMFGHIHEDFGYLMQNAGSGMLMHYSNAAGGYLSYYWKKPGGPNMITAANFNKHR